MTKVRMSKRSRKPKRISHAYRKYVMRRDYITCIPCKRVFSSARQKRRHCILLGHTPRIVAKTTGKDYSDAEKKDRTECMICKMSTRGKKGRIYTRLVNPREVTTCVRCVTEFHRSCLENTSVIQMGLKDFDDDLYGENESQLLRDFGDKLFDEATMPCCRSRVVEVAARGLTGIRTQFDQLWTKFVNGEREGLRELVKDPDAELMRNAEADE